MTDSSRTVESSPGGDLPDFSMTQIYKVLNDDIELVYPATPIENGMVRYPDPLALSQGRRRALIRAIFAFIEGLSYSQRVSLLQGHSGVLNPAVVMALNEKQIEITNAGEVSKKSIKASLISLVRMTVNQYMKCYKGSLNVQCAGAGFEGLVSSVKVRDRLMHPRSEHDLFVKDTEIERAVKGWLWFNQISLDMLVAEFEHLRQIAIDGGYFKSIESEGHKKVVNAIKEMKDNRKKLANASRTDGV